MLSRDDYKAIKKMDKVTLDAYITAERVAAYNEGVSVFATSIVDVIDAGIRKTPGIGEKRYAEIMKNILDEMHSASSTEGK